MNYDNDPFLVDFMGNWHYCRFCKHLHTLMGKPTCNAFPEGIPKDLISGPIFHNKPMLGQKNDTIFETKYK
jgi:hypothetical protein